MNLTEAPDFEKLVTFEPNRREPIHSWWWYKEGFSKALVDRLLTHLNVQKESLVLDSFCGSGTTLLACRQRGIASVGFEINPLLLLVSRVKTRDYDLDELAMFVKEARGWKFEKPAGLPPDRFIRRAFSKYALQDMAWLREKIRGIREESAREFLYLALVEAVMYGSWVAKEGTVIKIRKRKVAPVGKIFKSNIRRWLKDLKRAKLPPVASGVYAGDARRLPLGSGSIDAVITSPPYLNKPEWQTEFKVELNLFFGLPPSWRPPSVASDCMTERKMEEALPDYSTLPHPAQIYFSNIIDALGEMHRVLKKGGKAAVVIGGGCFPDRVVETDTCAAQLAAAAGFNVSGILVARHLWCTRARTIKVGQTRESILLLEKY